MSLKLIVAVLVTLAVVGSSLAEKDNRIVGGKNAADGQFPHQISLRRNKQHTCGGSIISNKHILTAAHCVVQSGVTPYPASQFSIYAGSTSRTTGGVEVAVSKVKVHEKYGNFLNDVAVLTLAKPLSFSKKIAQISLETQEIPHDAQVVISGWGRLSTNGDIPMHLQYNTLQAVSERKCFASQGLNDDSLLCLSHARNNGACNGDSGGPATYKGKLVGVAGFVVMGCGSSNPDGYAKVSHHIKWIKSNAV